MRRRTTLEGVIYVLAGAFDASTFSRATWPISRTCQKLGGQPDMLYSRALQIHVACGTAGEYRT